MQLEVARIGRPHGIGGEVTVEVRTDEPERRFKPGAVLLTKPVDAGPLTVESSRMNTGTLLLRFQGIKDRDAAEELRNVLLLVEADPNELPNGPDEFYNHQLIGLNVVTDDGIEVGCVVGIAQSPMQDLLIVELFGGGEAMIPFVTQIVTDILLVERRVIISPPPGLI
ncbi:ribosome maturation factor RimM [Streptomyces sp. NPDC048489]|uniref:ribosome maturation factor RimM n=1 Tax=Streptomyces sp. NPDC048489 TaxID=3154504 RepID=UPI0034445599